MMITLLAQRVHHVRIQVDAETDTRIFPNKKSRDLLSHGLWVSSIHPCSIRMLYVGYTTTAVNINVGVRSFLCGRISLQRGVKMGGEGGSSFLLTCAHGTRASS